MANSILDLQEVLFKEIDTIIKAHETGDEVIIRRSMQRNHAINETAGTILQAGELMLKGLVEASQLNLTSGGGQDIKRLVGYNDEADQ